MSSNQSSTLLRSRPRRNRRTLDLNGVVSMVKDPDSTEAVKWDFTEDLDTGDSVASYVLTSNGLTVVAQQLVSNILTVLFSGSNGDFEVVATTSDERVIAKKLRVMAPRPVKLANDYRYST